MKRDALICLHVTYTCSTYFKYKDVFTRLCCLDSLSLCMSLRSDEHFFKNFYVSCMICFSMLQFVAVFVLLANGADERRHIFAYITKFSYANMRYNTTGFFLSYEPDTTNLHYPSHVNLYTSSVWVYDLPLYVVFSVPASLFCLLCVSLFITSKHHEVSFESHYGEHGVDACMNTESFFWIFLFMQCQVLQYILCAPQAVYCNLFFSVLITCCILTLCTFMVNREVESTVVGYIMFIYMILFTACVSCVVFQIHENETNVVRYYCSWTWQFLWVSLLIFTHSSSSCVTAITVWNCRLSFVGASCLLNLVLLCIM